MRATKISDGYWEVTEGTRYWSVAQRPQITALGNSTVYGMRDKPPRFTVVKLTAQPLILNESLREVSPDGRLGKRILKAIGL